MKRCLRSTLPVFAFFALCTIADAQIQDVMIEHHYITRDLPGDVKTDFGAPALVDFDNDGDLDFAVSVPDGDIYWFEYREAGDWERHVLGTLPGGSLGSTSLDVDKDGWEDLIVAGAWYRNSGKPREERFTRYIYDSSVKQKNGVHDIITGDVDGNGSRDLLTTGEWEGCHWYGIPENPVRDVDWKRTEITLSVLESDDQIHAGLFPGGIGDLDGDGDSDVILADRWYENENGGARWTKHFLPFGKRGRYGLSARSVVIDINRDGDNDIVIADCDQEGSMIAILEHNGEKPPYFIRHFLMPKAPGIRGSFHSLQVADFDNDGDPDILVAEQEDPNIFPIGATPRCYIFENVDGTGKNFEERVIVDLKLGFHDVLIGDVDGDGDLDFCSKIWKAWAKNANGGIEHVDYYENLTK